MIETIDNKGQEAAPFELLVAVILMGFVILTGMYAMQQLWLQKCVGTTEAKLEEMKTIIETTVSQKSPLTVSLKLSGCFNEQKETVIVKDVIEPKVCAQICGTPKNLCTIMDYVSTDSRHIFSIKKCLDIPPDTSFPSQAYSGKKCPPTPGYVLQNIREGMPQGDYQLINKTLVTDSFPTICVYRKEG